MQVIRTLVALSLVVAAACGGPGSTASPSPTASSAATTPAPTASSAASSPAPSPSTSASGTPIPLPTSAQVAAAGNGVVWMLVADHLYRSTDKGVTWQQRKASATVNGNIAFIDDQNGWSLSAGSPATGCNTQQFEVFRTTDGATSWQSVFKSQLLDPGCKHDLVFTDAQHGYISASSADQAPFVYRTSDGGVSWSASPRMPDPAGWTTQPGGFTLHPGPVADFGSAQLVYATGQAGGKQLGYVFRSIDRGATWSPTNTATPESGVVIITPTRWIQISSPGDSKETTDGGASWHGFATDYQQAAPIAPQIAFGDAQTGYATVRGGLQRTTDGGAHWTALKTPGT